MNSPRTSQRSKTADGTHTPNRQKAGPAADREADQEAVQKANTLDLPGIGELSEIAKEPSAQRDPVGVYMAQAGFFPVLSEQEELTLGKELVEARRAFYEALLDGGLVPVIVARWMQAVVSGEAKLGHYFRYDRQGRDELGGHKGALARMTINVRTLDKLLCRVWGNLIELSSNSCDEASKERIKGIIIQDRLKISTILEGHPLRRVVRKGLMDICESAVANPQAYIKSLPAEVVKDLWSKLGKEGEISPEHRFLLVFCDTIKGLSVQQGRIEVCRAALDELHHKLANHNLRLVIKEAFRKTNDYEQLLTLIQEGNVALLRAADLWDPSRGKFSTYATGGIKKVMPQARLEHVNQSFSKQNARQIAKRTKQAQEGTLRDTGRGATVHDVAEYLGVSFAIAQTGMQLRTGALSLNQPSANTQGPKGEELGNLLASPQATPLQIAQVNEIRSLLEPSAGHLEERDAEVLRLLFGILSEDEHEEIQRIHCFNSRSGLKLREVAKVLGMSHENVRNVRDKSLEALRRVYDV
jgi:RNA polymerase sigma factor (sigma-70 family)